MWQSLIVLHRTPALSGIELLDNSYKGFIQWHTCQRSIWIGDSRISNTSPEDFPDQTEIRYGYEAYRFLLEVVTGIRSKLYGESEIQSQFIHRFSKENLQNMGTLSHYCVKLRDDILEHSRKLRNKFFTGHGRQTYGGIADSILPDSSRVAIIGTGNLTESILTHLIKKDRIVTVIGRNESRLKEFQSRFPVFILNRIEELPCDHHLVIAAPIEIDKLCERLNPSLTVVDFRGESTWVNPRQDLLYIPFQEILMKIEATSLSLQRINLDLHSYINKLVQEREDRLVQMPHCWEDLLCHT